MGADFRATSGGDGTVQADTVVIGGNTISGTELGYVDGITPGTVTASKAVVVDSNKRIDTLVIADGGLKLGTAGGTAVTSTAAELNLLDGSVAGTAVASKALALGATKNVDTLLIDGLLQSGATASSALYLGGGTSGSPLTTATADKNFVDYRTQSTATSGDCRAAYLQLTLGGTIATTGYGDAVRPRTIVTGTGYSAAVGTHSTLQINSGGTVTGLGAAVRATLDVAAAEAQGSIYALQVETIASAAVTATEYSYVRFTSSTSGGGTKPGYFMILDSVDTTDLFVANTDTPDKGLKVKINGTDYWIMVSQATS